MKCYRRKPITELFYFQVFVVNLRFGTAIQQKHSGRDAKQCYLLPLHLASIGLARNLLTTLTSSFLPLPHVDHSLIQLSDIFYLSPHISNFRYYGHWLKLLEISQPKLLHFLIHINGTCFFFYFFKCKILVLYFQSLISC